MSLGGWWQEFCRKEYGLDWRGVRRASPESWRERQEFRFGRLGNTAHLFVFFVVNKIIVCGLEFGYVCLGCRVRFERDVMVQVFGVQIEKHCNVRALRCRFQLEAGELVYEHILFRGFVQELENGLLNVAYELRPHSPTLECLCNKRRNRAFALGARYSYDFSRAVCKKNIGLRGEDLVLFQMWLHRREWNAGRFYDHIVFVHRLCVVGTEIQNDPPVGVEHALDLEGQFLKLFSVRNSQIFARKMLSQKQKRVLPFAAKPKNEYFLIFQLRNQH
ncbi:MAG: hypothetical protein UY53_C0002G0007 [Parcubacteria group bacterium GW2011_GWA2_50_10]|nr:MAG: hypothetical protein UY53_C0002G0007 [Parcubacteria group bacterium GW2011_GWA2_50_10]